MENQKQVQVVRHFSESFKQEKVREIERNLTTVMQVSKVYGVTRAAVYKWLINILLTVKSKFAKSLNS